MDWDYFISHASEDKQLIVSPFAHYLKSAGFGVWFDDFTLTVGDSLLQSISRGLRDSRFAVVFFSPAFFAKRWPQHELNGLHALESTGGKRILPVWHEVSQAEVAENSPILADRKAADTRRGLQNVAEQIVAASFPDRVRSLPLSSAVNAKNADLRVARSVLRQLLTESPTTNDIYLYLSGYPSLLTSRLGFLPTVVPGFKLPGPLRCEFAEFNPRGVSGLIEVVFVVLGPLDYDHAVLSQLVDDLKQQIGPKEELHPHPYNGIPCFREYPKLTEMGAAIQEMVPSKNCHWEDPSTWIFQVTLISGRRNETPRGRRFELVQGSGMRIEIASYDSLLDDYDMIYA